MSTEQKPIGWVRYNRGGRSGVFNTGAECPPGWVGAAFPVYEAASPAAQPTLSEAVEAGWNAALRTHSHHGMSGWSSHRHEMLKLAINKLHAKYGTKEQP